MFVVPLYFQVTANATPSSAGFYLVPAVVGNTVGGLATGAYIKRSGRYKSPMALAAVVAGLCHTLLALRWTGHTGILEAMYIFPGGIGTGIAHSSTFVAITAGTIDEELAIAGGGLYLCGGFGSVLGVTVASSALRVIFKRVASANVGNDPAAKRVIEKALADIGFIDGLKGKLREAILDAYVWGFRANFGESICTILEDQGVLTPFSSGSSLLLLFPCTGAIHEGKKIRLIDVIADMLDSIKNGDAQNRGYRK